ncbi:ABC transporter [Limnohabitans sp. JirII-29]|uniref:MlaA family lipoprotein n=1 Tax=unclassified Limnohabitans TaxID=2626134 RepID=UPI000C1DE9F6|nr:MULTISPECIES: VacJ family lipoprotein [unclassified Limnohabitans]PIT75970.1 ABC transporter [Limnohabitans sp. JirII-31]PUE24733.1 ABC transporter [Limnohabitans sp. JirII-29]
MSVRSVKHWARALVCASALVFLGGCATGPNANPKDPLEPMNRSITRFNDSLDDNVLKPVATGYRDVTPELVQKGVRNVFNNLSDMWSTVNSGLQLKGRDTAESFMRVVVNTVFGVYGIFDVATEIKLQRHLEDFGQTLGYWGVPNGPYLVLPLLGPSTVRDTAGLPFDTSADAVRQVEHIPTRNSAMALRIVEKRASLLNAGNLLEEASLDKYSFTRDAYLQYRRSQIYDGNPPDEDEPDYSAEPPASAK